MDKSFTDLFEEQVAKTPDNIAVVFEQEQLSYRGLNERANMLAHHLQSKGVKQETLVPLYLERGINMIIGMLGIMKAGGAYVPIDTDFPQERIAYMLKDTAATIVVSTKKSSQILKAITGIEVIEIEEIKDANSDNLQAKVLPGQLAYVIYTSGSTGAPKGVMIEHRNLVDYISGLADKTQINECKSFALVSTIATDLGNTVIYASLASGGALHLFTKESVSDIEFLHQYFAKNKIECLKIVPSHWKVLNMDDKLLLPAKLLVFGGEALQERVVKSIRETGTHCRVVNHYGPTETTIGKLLHIVEPGAEYEYTVPIGKPFSNTKVLVLNKNLKLCPKGVPGELYITGDGVARGYLNNPELTKEKFIPNPFAKGDYAVMYSTGDLVKYLPDGNVEFIGRVDNQVKIRGYRIELGEIESHLQKSELVNNGVVIVNEDKQGNKRLVAYVVAQGSFDREGIFSYLKEKLPEYMLPAIIMELESLPLTPNGKVDRKALPEPEAMEAGDKYIAPRNGVEERLAAIWEDILEVDKIGINDDFFELGGHSLLAIRLTSMIRKELQTEVKIGDVFDYPTIALLSVHLTSQDAKEVLPAILVAPRPDRIPLSFSQERLLFIDQLEGSIPYHIPSVFRLKGNLNLEALQFALQQIIARHEVLRTTFKEEEGVSFQYIKPIEPVILKVIDDPKYRADAEQLNKCINELIKSPFDLSKDNMLRVSLIKLDAQEYIMVCTMHHIASDAWSTSILVKEVVELYNSYLENRVAQLSLLQLQYADYSLWQRNYLQGEILQEKIEYWRNKLSGVTPLALPTDFPRPVIQSSKGASFSFKIDKEISAELQNVSKQTGATLFMTLLSALNVLLYRYSAQEDICIGTPVAGRQQPEVEGLIGFFINTLVLRNEINGSQNFRELLEEVRATTMEAYDHQDLPFEKVVEAVVKQRDLGRTPLFQVMLILQNTPEVPQFSLGDLVLSRETSEHTSAKFDLTFIINETEEGLRGSVQYCSDLYKASTIEAMLNHYKELLHSIIKAPGEKVSDLKMLSVKEEEQVIKSFNETQSDYPKDKTVTQLFEDQVNKTAENVALIFEEEKITYQELNEKSNQLANYLRRIGVKAETLVPVCLERGIEMVTVILGILKAGGAYVPIDPEYPQDRISYMLEDTGAKLVVTNKASKAKLGEDTKATIIEIDTDKKQINKESKENLDIQIATNSLAYIIYTSGSTGKPKGVMIEHQSLLNYLLNSKTRYINADKEEGSGSYVHLSYTFDASLTGMFMPLLWGRPVVIASNKMMNVFEDKNLLKYAPYDFIKLTPSHLEIIGEIETENNQSWLTDKLVIGGEAIHATHFNYFIEKGIDIEIINEYGPTEATVGCSTYKFRTGEDMEQLKNGIPIGKPIDNTQIYITGSGGEILPAGIWGEITIGGEGIARGYLNREELTKEKFIEDPFGIEYPFSKKEENRKLYKTGDIGRWQPDGTIEYQGRKDDQVKIRGYRIELGEIENVILQSGSIRQAVVLARTNTAGNKYLAAYVVPEEKFEKEAIIKKLSTKLPEYMIPAVWIELEEIPLTSNGKIDRKALPETDASQQISNEYVAPKNETEEKLAAIWQQLLGVERVGVTDNFFELGGHSLLAMRMVSAVRRQLAKEMPIKDLFVYPTITALSIHLQEQAGEDLLPAIEVQARPGKIPLSFSQERLWFIDQMEGSIQYHIPAVLRLTGTLNKEALQKALKEIVNRHEVLRTIFIAEDGKASQLIHENDRWELTALSWREDKQALQEYIQQTIRAPFDLQKDYMLRSTLVELGDEEHLLVVTIHHIASDGWSMPLIVKEVSALYKSYSEDTPVTLQPLELQYADYAIWQRNYLQDKILERKIAYWKGKLEDVTTLELPLDYPRPAIQGIKGSTLRFGIPKELSNQLHRLSQREGSTIFMTLLASLNVLLQKYSGQEDITIGSPVANRTQSEIENLVGFFLNTLALRSEVKGNATFKELLQQVKSTTTEAYNHQDLPFEKVVEAVVKERDLSRTPLFQVMLVLQNTTAVSALDLGELQLQAEETLLHSAKFELTFSISENESGLQVAIDYNTDLYKTETIERMSGHYIKLLESIVKNPGEKLSKLKMLGEAEEERLVKAFNNTAVGYPRDKSITDLFEEQVNKTPGAIALVFEEEQISYQELNERANKLANYLRKKGVQEETLVPICIERSIEMIAGILGILKAGGAYVPIDPEYPEERISYMLEDTGAKIIVSNKKGNKKLPGMESAEIIEIDGEAVNQEPAENLQINIRPNNLAYIIYTSGSTGKPKGVMIEHQAVLDHCYGLIKSAGLSDCKSFTLFAPLVFDAGHAIIFSSLFLGASLNVLSKEQITDGEKLSGYLEQHPVDCIKIVPSVWLSYAGEDNRVLAEKVMIFGGESFSGKIPGYLKKLNYQGKVYNHYGPTEATIGKTIHEVDLQKNYTTVPIGKPFSNTRLYVTDQQGELVAHGVAGELYIAGEGIARGYLNREELTREKFIEDLFTKQKKSRLYKTGDKVRWNQEGEIEYLGRIDEQVKIRGHRIELGEIEQVLSQAEGVKDAAVTTIEDNQGNKQLAGYIVAEGTLNKEELVKKLRGKLPEYMIPLFWMEIAELPLSSNGKVNKKALPKPEISELVTSGYVSPSNETEEKLATIWQDLLGITKIGIHDNFFELGGDSILTIQVVSRARRLGYELQPRDIFLHQTIGKLSQAIADRSEATVTGEQGMLKGFSGLLPIQQRYLQKEPADISHFNQSILLKINKEITETVLREAVKQLSIQHDALRFKYFQKEGAWYQEYSDLKAEIIDEDLADVSPNKQSASIKEYCEKYHRSLDIEKGDLMRAVLMRTSDKEEYNRLFITIHHLAIDGVSWRILMEDMELLLSRIITGDQTPLGYKSNSYRQWYEALEQYSHGGGLLSQKKYWSHVIKNYSPLIVDKKYIGQLRMKDMGQYSQRLDADQTIRLLQEVPKVYHTEINDILLAALAITICKWSMTGNITIGLEGHGREEIAEKIDISRTVGWFTSLYPVLLEVNTTSNNADDLIKSIKEQLRRVPDKGIGFGVLKYINKEETLQGNDPWEIVFNYLGQSDNMVKEMQWFATTQEPTGSSRSENLSIREKLLVNCIVKEGMLHTNWSYSTKHFETDTIESLASSYISSLETLIAHCLETEKTGVVYTPSDYGLGSEISYEELDQFLNEGL